MFRFEHPIYLYLLLVIPLLVMIRIFFDLRRKKRLGRFGDADLVKDMMEDVSPIRPKVKFWMLTSERLYSGAKSSLNDVTY